MELGTKSLFDLERTSFGEYLEFPFPWEILPRISELIRIISMNFEINYTEPKSGVFVHKTAKISPFSEICAPALIGEGSEIRRGAYLRGNTLIGAGCVVGNCCEVKNSVLMDGAVLPHFNYVGDSVLGRFAHLGAGAILSNLKGDRREVVIHAEEEIFTGLKKCGAFLGDGVEVGCGAVLNPGCVVGKDSRIYPLVSLRGVIPAGTIVKQ